MNIQEFAAFVKEACPDLTHAYIAIIPNDDGTVYNLEVESDLNTIAAMFATDDLNDDHARSQADQLETELSKLGVHVFNSREIWEEHHDGPDLN